MEANLFPVHFLKRFSLSYYIFLSIYITFYKIKKKLFKLSTKLAKKIK